MRQTALVTGAAKRIGRTIAVDLATQGWDVAIHYLHGEEDAHETLELITQNGGTAKLIKADLNDATETAGIVKRCADLLSPPTCLINNGSIFEYDDIHSMDESSWNAHINVNLKAPILLSQAFAKALPKGAKGNIINIVDQRVRKLTPQYFSYTIAKSALWTATQTLAQALAPNIRVNAIGPGPILRSIHQSEEQFDTQRQATLLKQGSTPEEIAQTIRFILDSPALTGQLIALDGGQHLAWQTPDVLGVE